MKRLCHWLAMMIVIIAACAGCSSPAPASVATNAATATPDDEPQAGARATGTLPATELPSPTVEHPPTATVRATLTADEEGTLLSTLLLTNAGCELPCWWGLQPGVTTEQEAWELIQAYALEWEISDVDFRTFGLGYPLAGVDHRFRDVGVRLWINEGIVKLVEVDGIRRRDDSQTMFVKDWQNYSPAAIIGRYGRPELVEFSKVENSSYYQLTLAYDSLGIQMTYILPFTVTDAGKRQICFGLDTIDYIYPSLYVLHQSDELPIKLLVSRQDAHASWEETTGQTLDDFMVLALNSGCVQISP
jgi:hypothetical protein